MEEEKTISDLTEKEIKTLKMKGLGYPMEKVEEDRKKTYQLLKFYKKNKISIKFTLLNRPISYSGTIEKLSTRFASIFYPSIILKSEKEILIKVFLEDIDHQTIMPKDIKQTMPFLINRISLQPKLRFEVLKRDNFTCQYCGKKHPEVELEVDHVHPVSKGGQNDVNNLITSCKDCNRGKTNQILTIDS